jgi:hypothetical protein
VRLSASFVCFLCLSEQVCPTMCLLCLPPLSVRLAVRLSAVGKDALNTICVYSWSVALFMVGTNRYWLKVTIGLYRSSRW